MKDLGLGNPNGIPSRLAEASDEEIQEDGERFRERLATPDNLTCFECIDGRFCKCNADGTEAIVHLRRVGGSAANLGVALNAECPVVSTLEESDSLGRIIHKVDAVVGDRSAHLGGCGGANGEVDDNEAICNNPAILDVTKALMSIPAVAAYLECEYSDEDGERVRRNAGMTAEFLRAKGWNGQAYVDGVTEEAPGNVEDLEVDEDDHVFHGHKEPAVDIIIGDKTAPLDHDGFVWNLCTTKAIAEKLADGDEEVYRRVVIAEVAKHLAVADRLPSVDTPVRLHTVN